ncbi:outer membrane protein assembly factor BamC [Gammaproteobacteria bacterium]|nr:outer membrane protein assembly factor BamC [Gammaproteobacteria bacterium]
MQDKKIIDASENENILLEKNVIRDSSFISDKYPISGEIEVTKDQAKVLTPRPKQLFSAASSNEIRLHKLGEIRWVYLGLEPSAAWPMTIEFLENKSNLGLDSFDPNSGTINSKVFELNNIDSKFIFKIERGLQQSSSEIFISQLKRINNSWEIVSSKDNKLDNVIEEFYEYLSSSGPATGTSLVALNLNASNKTEVITDEISGLSKIKLRINFARAWAALRRSLLLAGYKIIDENRNEGKFYLEYSVRRSLLDRRPDITSVEIIVKELSSKECLISTNLDVENLDLSEEIISQINQSLS